MKTTRRHLLELTSLPTASGREDRVIQWVTRWAARRPAVQLKRDRFGNILLKLASARSRQPIIFAAHMDHPAFVVTAVGSQTVGAEFRGGVSDAYFQGAPVLLHHARSKPQPGRITALHPAQPPAQDKNVVVQFETKVNAAPGDVITWDIPPARIDGDRLYAPACDDLAGVAAALAAFDELLARPRARTSVQPPKASAASLPDVRVLLTRAEEVGFVGALAACRSGLIPKQGRIIALENSKSFAPDSPIGGGPIVRVGDKTSTFDPHLTYQLSTIAAQLQQSDPTFHYQRRLMPGGTCEASAYQAMGYAATCLCLPLGRYHNMNELTQRIDAETISLADYDGLVRLLVHATRALTHPALAPSFRNRLDELFEKRRALLAN
jgi:endoglucanase